MPTFILPSPHTPAAASTERYLAAATAIRAKSLDPQEKCCYPSKRCENPRVVKSNGELHRFCDEHRARANLNQRRLEERRREHQHQQPATSMAAEMTTSPFAQPILASRPSAGAETTTTTMEAAQAIMSPLELQLQRQLRYQDLSQPAMLPLLMSIQAYVEQLDRQFWTSAETRRRFPLAPSQQPSGILQAMDLDEEDLRVLVDVLTETDDGTGGEHSDTQIYRF